MATAAIAGTPTQVSGFLCRPGVLSARPTNTLQDFGVPGLKQHPERELN